MSTFNPSPAQQRIFDWADKETGNALVIAVAGAGKSTTMVQLVKRVHGQIIMLAFGKAAAAELYDKIDGKPGAFAKTFHAAGFQALRFAFGKGNRLEIDQKKVEKVVRAMVLEKARDDLLPLVGTVSAMVSMAKQQGIGALEGIPLRDDGVWLAMVDHFALDDSLPEGREGDLIQCVQMAQEALRRSCMDLDTIDMDDMIYLPVQRQLRLLKHDWVIIDEAQDSNPIRIALAKRLLGPRGRLIAVGDPRQAIMGFAGALNDAMDNIKAQFNCVELPLTVTYRCPKTVVDVARRYVDHITAHETAPDGFVSTYDYADVLGAVQIGDAVLCRFNKYLVSLAFALIRTGVPAKIEGRDIGEGLAKLAGRWSRIKTLTALTGKLEEHLDRELAKAKAKDDERRADMAQDQFDTMMVLIDRAKAQGMTQVEELQTIIRSMFDDSTDGVASPCVRLCSLHRSKGREWPRVHILGLDELTARTSRSWATIQECNLKYVGATRAKDTLLLVTGVKQPN